jgi:hypothetical protein
MARAHLRGQVYGLSDLAESNDLDSDIASLADWLRLGALTWHSLATGQHRPGRLKLEPPLQSSASMGVSADIMAGAGGAAGSAPARQWCAILHISYDTRYQHQRWWCSGQSSFAVCMRSMVRISILCIFLQDVLYAYIRLYTDLYPDTQCLYTYIRSCSSIHVLIRVYNEVYRVILVCMLIYFVHTSIYWFVLSTAVAFCQVVSFLRDFRQTKESIVYQSTDFYILQHFSIFLHEWSIWWLLRFQKAML